MIKKLILRILFGKSQAVVLNELLQNDRLLFTVTAFATSFVEDLERMEIRASILTKKKNISVPGIKEVKEAEAEIELIKRFNSGLIN